MTLRTKLLLGYAGFVLALGVLGAWSARTLSQMSAVSGRIIAENYDSVVAAQDMKESLERQDSAALFDLLGEHDRARRQARRAPRAIRRGARAARRPTSPRSGEREAIEAIRRGRDEYYRRFDAFHHGRRRSHRPRTSQSLEPQLQRGPRRRRSTAATEPGSDAAQGRRRVADREALVLRDAGAGARPDGGRRRHRAQPVAGDRRAGRAS